jgi:hypothetical protein
MSSFPQMRSAFAQSDPRFFVGLNLNLKTECDLRANRGLQISRQIMYDKSIRFHQFVVVQSNTTRSPVERQWQLSLSPRRLCLNAERAELLGLRNGRAALRTGG